MKRMVPVFALLATAMGALAAFANETATIVVTTNPTRAYRGVNTPNITLSATLSGASGNNHKIDFYVNNVPFGVVTANSSGVATMQVTYTGTHLTRGAISTLAVGENRIEAALERGQNTVRGTTIFTVDAPVSVSTETSLQVSPGSALLGSTDPVTLTATVTANGQPVPNHSSVLFYVDEDILIPGAVATSNGVATKTVDVSSLAANGHTFKAVYQTSPSPVISGSVSYEYQSSCDTQDFEIIADQLAPETQVTLSNADPDHYPAPNAAEWFRGPVRVELNVTDDNTGVRTLRYQIDKQETIGGPVQVGTPVSVPGNNQRSFTYVLPQPVAGDGVYTLYYSAVDASNNEERATDSLYKKREIRIDGTRPVITKPDDIVTEATSPAGAVVSFAVPTALDAVAGVIPVMNAPESGATYGLGEREFNLTATDLADNVAEALFRIRVVDTTPPVINNAPEDMIVEATGPDGAAVTYSATATDIADSSVEVLFNPPSGSILPLGETKVEYSATDDSGNAAGGFFFVTVRDTTDPVIENAPQDLTVEATGPNGAVVTYSASATDLVDPSVEVVFSPASGSTLALGATLVSYYAEDDAGNRADGSFTVTVQDTTPPAIAAQADLTATATANNGAQVFFTPSAVDLVDPEASVNAAPPSGSWFPVGTTEVTITARDDAGNVATRTFNVRVTYAWSGVLQPINGPGSPVSVFKQGSTIPVKFQIPGITNAVAKLYVARVGDTLSGEEEAVSTAAADSGNQFRYDSTNSQYIFNLSTKSLQAGLYRLRIDLGDGVERTVNVSLRK
ncbi:MAG: HYR domain-containing protein [Armatimonadota bacterium]